MINITRLLSTIFFLFFCTLTHLQAQLAPNFTETDMNGNEQDLYSILDEGKLVVIDIFTTWCGPCWDLHEEEVLKNIWNTYGPEGTDEMYVLSVESDLMTTADDLNGTGDNTLGDWLTDTPYPIINITEEGPDGRPSIESKFTLFGYPTIVVICPDRTLKYVNYWDLQPDLLLNEYSNCSPPEGENNMSILFYNGFEGNTCKTESFAPGVTVQNKGINPVNSFTSELYIDGALTESVKWTGELKPFGVTDIMFPDNEYANVDIEIKIVNPNEGIDSDENDNAYVTSVQSPPTTAIDSVTVEILTDEYPTDTYWRIEDDAGNIIVEGGNLSVGLDVNNVTSNSNEPPSTEGSYEPFTLNKINVGLPRGGCYIFKIADFFRDGLCCGTGNGYYKIVSYDNGDLLIGDEYTTHREDAPFGLSQSTSTEDQWDETDIVLTPNPASDVIIIDLNASKKVIKKIDILNSVGQLQSSVTNNGETISRIDISDLEEGNYIIKVYSIEGKSSVTKFIKL